ncbi:MAG: lysophospholipase [Chloroflexota bacterium]
MKDRELIEHIEGEFHGYGGLTLYYQGWLPPNRPRAVLLVVHGLAEHSGRFGNLVNRFVPAGYGIYGFDQRGHGKSPGLRGYVDNFSSFVNDLGNFLRVVRSKHKDTKIFLVGHSVGGTIATTYAVSHQDEFDGLILSGATLKAGASVSPVLITVARLLSLFVPKVGLYTIEAAAISRDKSVVDAYLHDPLVYRGKIRARLGVEIIKAMQELPYQMSKIRLPVLILHGTADRLSEPGGSRMLYDRVGSGDKILKLYDGFFHEVFNEPGREQVFADVESWLATHR